MEENYWTQMRRQRLSRRRLLGGVATAGAGVAGLALVGCGDDDDDDDGGAKSSATGTAGAGAGSGKIGVEGGIGLKTPADTPYYQALADHRPPKKGGTLKDLQSIDFLFADPLKSGVADVANFHGLASAYLVNHDSSPDSGASFFEEKIKADLAVKWEQPDNRTFVFELNPKAKWHDRPPASGRPVTAEDIKYSFERLASAGGPKPRFEPVERIEVVSPTQVKITLKRPTVDMLDTFAFEYHPIVNREWIESKGGELPVDASFVGCGPFVLTSMTKDVGSVWTRNPNFHEADKAGTQLPYLDKIEYFRIRDSAARRAAFDSSQIHHTDTGWEDFERYSKDPNVYITKTGAAAGQTIIAFNLRLDQYKDERIRKAVSMSIDRKLLSDQLYKGAGAPAFTLPPKALGQKSLPGWDKLPPSYQFNPAEAKKLLTAAGHPNGIDLGPMVYWNFAQSVNDKALLIQDGLKQAGITVKPQGMEQSQIYPNYFAGKFEAVQMIYSQTPGVNDQAWVDWIHSTAPTNYWGINDPALDALVEKARAEFDTTKRRDILKQIQDLEIEKAYRVWVDQQPLMRVHKKSIINLRPLAFHEFHYHGYRYTWLDA